MKKLLVFAIAIIFPTAVFAHGGYRSQDSDGWNDDRWRAMNDMREIMHNTVLNGEKTEKGVVFEITANSDRALESLEKAFVEDRKQLEAFFKGVSVSVDSLENSVKLNLESENDDTVKRLQAYGPQPIYRYLHASFDIASYGMGYHGRGSGMMHGYGRGHGYMHGSGYGMGAGPCPNYPYPEKEGDSGRPMHWNDDFRGYGRGMM